MEVWHCCSFFIVSRSFSWIYYQVTLCRAAMMSRCLRSCRGYRHQALIPPYLKGTVSGGNARGNWAGLYCTLTTGPRRAGPKRTHRWKRAITGRFIGLSYASDLSLSSRAPSTWLQDVETQTENCQLLYLFPISWWIAQVYVQYGRLTKKHVPGFVGCRCRSHKLGAEFADCQWESRERRVTPRDGMCGIQA